jgi:CDP-diglyceride synthetase
MKPDTWRRIFGAAIESGKLLAHGVLLSLLAGFGLSVLEKYALNQTRPAVALTGLLLSYAVGGGILLVVLLDIGIVFRALGWILLYLLLAVLVDSAGLVLGDRWFGTRE